MNTGSSRAEPKHPIQVVARRTDLSADVLRAWERRYQAVQPQRSASGRRLYSDADVERLSLLRRVTLSGRSIAQVAQLPDERLEEMVAADSANHRGTPPNPSIADPHDPDAYVERGRAALDQHAAGELHNVLLAAGDTLGPEVAAERVFAPLLQRIAASWSQSDASMTVRHVAAALARSLQEKAAGN